MCVYVYINVYMVYMVFTTERFFEVAIESWLEWDSNPPRLNSVQTLQQWVQLALRANFVQLLQFHLLFSVTFHFGYCLRQWPRYLN